MNKWYEDTIKQQGVIVASRIRLARNIKDHVFPATLSTKDATSLIHEIRDGLTDLELPYKELGYVSDSEKMALREHRVINSAMASCKRPMGLLLAENQSKSILIGGDDHLRIQCIEPGAALHKVWQEVNTLDDQINEKFAYAFDEKYGYLTAFPTNVGTGMRVSVTLHLPIIAKSRSFKKLIEEVSRIGLTLKGIHGDVSENYGDLYRICNQKTLGQSEEDIIDSVERIAFQLANQERKARVEIARNGRKALEDEVYKSFGVLKYARRLSLKEALIYLSQIRLGQIDDILHFEEPLNVYGLMLDIQQGSLEQYVGHKIEEEEAGYVRAKYLREQIPDVI